MRWFLAAATSCAVMLVGAAAQAGGPQSDAFILSGDRMLGIGYSKLDRDGPDPDGVTSVRFSWTPVVPSPYEAPRFGFDYVFDSGLTLGGNLGIATWHQGDQDDFGFLFYPRIGYMVPIAQYSGFWIRGGPSYYSFDETDWWGLGLTVEGMFVLALTDGFGFILGPYFDFDFAGERNDNDTKWRSFGIAFGLAGWI